MNDRITQLQKIVKESNSICINSEFLDYEGIVSYYPEELIITVKAGLIIKDMRKELNKNNQDLMFFVDDENISIGAAYANGGQDLSDSVLGVQIIDGNGNLLNFGGQVIKNVAGYDVSRLLVGSKGKLALITEISFKVLPNFYVGKLVKPLKQKTSSKAHKIIEQKLKQVFDPKGIFK